MPATQVADLFVKIGAKAQEYDQTIKRVEQHVVAAQNKLAINPNVNPASIKSLEAELKRLKDRAQELRGNLLTIKPTVENPNAVKDLEHELAKVESRIQLVTATTNNLREASKKLGEDFKAPIQRMKEMGEKAVKAGEFMTKYVTLPMVAAGTALLALAGKTGQYAEDMSNLSESSGLSTTRLQELKFMADQMGLSFDSVTTASGMLQMKLMGVENDSGAAAAALKMLGVNVHDSNGELRSMDSLFPELIAKLQGMTNKTERNMIAAQLFGRGWRELGPILGLTAEQMEAMRQKAHALGLVMSTDALAAAQAFDDKLDDLKAQALGLARGFAMELMPVIEKDLLPIVRDQIIPAVKSLIKHIIDWIKWFRDLSPEGKKVVEWLVLMLAILGPVTVGVGKFGMALAGLRLGGIIGAGGTLATVFGAIKTGALAAAGAITTLTGAVAAAIVAGVLIPAFGSGYVSAKRQQAAGVNRLTSMRNDVAAIGSPTHNTVARDMGFIKIEDDYDKFIDTASPQQKAAINAEYKRQRTAYYAQKNPAAAAGTGLPGANAGQDDATKAADIRYQIAFRNANDMGQLYLERDKKMSEAGGPAERQALADDYTDRVKALKIKQAKEAKELQDKQAKEAREAAAKAYKEQLALAEKAREERQANFEEELKALIESKAAEMRYNREYYQADVFEANAALQNKLRLLMAEAVAGKDVAWRVKDAHSQHKLAIQAIDDKKAKDDADYAEQALRLQLENDRAAEESKVSMWTKARDVLAEYADKVAKFFFGEGAMRLQQLERERQAERQNIMESIKDEELRASTLDALDASFAMRRQDIYDEENKRFAEERERWAERMRAMTGFTSADAAWQAVTQAGAQLAFAGPQVNNQIAGPSVNVGGGAELSRIAQLLEYGNSQAAISAAKLRELNDNLARI